MARNLASTSCKRCGTLPRITGEVHPLSRSEAGCYFEEFEGMLVAEAECPLCGALYLAWVDETTRARRHGWARETPERGFVDLSFRSSFNDEPGEHDLPPWMLGEEYGKRERDRGRTEALDDVRRAVEGMR